jgi:hypothetical protein
MLLGYEVVGKSPVCWIFRRLESWNLWRRTTADLYCQYKVRSSNSDSMVLWIYPWIECGTRCLNSHVGLVLRVREER